MQKEIEWGIHSFFISYKCHFLYHNFVYCKANTITDWHYRTICHTEPCTDMHLALYMYLLLVSTRKVSSAGTIWIWWLESYTSWLPWVLRNKKEKRHNFKKYQRTLYCCFTYYSTINWVSIFVCGFLSDSVNKSSEPQKSIVVSLLHLDL